MVSVMVRAAILSTRDTVTDSLLGVSLGLNGACINID